ncbi:hypothetical protein KP509_03G064800 [Ceratopteris richardii]|uniref:Tyrosinase copper-binding domain-containing protein n=3 Tax=Ceratopteris richardii TaxID=49495 RepID=A0A8T2V7L2_CERRI|nr:hypothetical protein KP509_03G064800 [Ceratopteris richardii]
MATQKSLFLHANTSLGTTSVEPNDYETHSLVYRYPLPVDDSGAVDVTTAVVRENVLDFFYPHMLMSGGEQMTDEALNKMKMRRDVFLLAFADVQALDANDRWSFYQIAGIHGLPHAPFDGVDNGDWDPRNPDWWGGYCQHGSPLFPTWHRPYVMLLEQSIIRQAKQFATTLSDADEKAAVQDIADDLRFPYLDWANQSSRVLGLPEVFTITDVPLLYPWKSFSATSIPNPLKSFVMPVNVGKPFSSSDVYNPTAKPNYVVPSQGTPYTPEGYATVRHVNASYQSQNDKLNVTLMRNANTTLVEGVHAMFQHNQWLPFSNHFWSEETHGDGSQYGHYASLELVHDFVHGTLGGSGGHMAYPEVAAFDPIFFFHHCNVDRLVALWQYCYPNSWIPAKPLQLNSEGTYTDEPDSQANAKTPLTPFRSSAQNANIFVTSNDVRLVDAQCGYSYPEVLLARKEGWTPAQMLDYVLKLYEPPENFIHRWVLMIERIVKRAFNGPFRIRVFIGKPDADSTTSLSIPNFAGEIQVFARSTGVRCANCEQKQCMRASLDLTKTMVRLGLATTPLANARDDPFSSDAAAPRNPFTIPGSLRLVFVDMQGRQLDPSTALGSWQGPKVSLYYEKGVPREQINEFMVDDDVNVSPQTLQKIEVSYPQLSIAGAAQRSS